MSSYYTSDELIKSVKRRAMIPKNQNTFDNEDFLAFADEEMNLGLLPSVLRMHEDYYLRTEEISLVQGQIRYSIPYRAIGNKLRDVSFKDGSGSIFEMTRISVEDVSYYQGSSAQNRIYAFYIENNEIVLVPDNVTFGSGSVLRVSFYLRPNSLVTLDSVAVITDINRTTGVIQVSNMPEEFSASKLMDFVKVKSPHKIIDYDIQPASVNTTSKTITFDVADIPSELEVGDHVCLATETAIPQLPSDLHVVLAHRVASRCLEAIGDLEGLQAANQKLAEMEQQTTVLIDNRVEGAPKKVVNRHGILRSGLNAKRYRFRG